ncbi:MAG: hypothetical protein KJP00_01965 [Bacteroidia bacterium]|nr:hypothetical protein [Bacteroidia bacterium]
MARFRMFKVPEHQKFEYRPRYWDPKKDKQDALKERIRMIQGQSMESTKARITSNLRSGFGGDPRLRSKLVSRSNYRIIAIIGFLVLLSYFLLDRYMPLLEKFIGN